MAHDFGHHYRYGRPTGPAAAISDLWRLIAGQTAMLIAGFATAQGCSFLRNVIIAHTLARGEFGIAATILLTLQVIETVTDMGCDRLIVEADDGARRSVVGTAQAMLVVRGLVTAILIVVAAWPAAMLFDIPDAAPVFAAAALAPAIRGFLNLDMRRAQRALDNRPYMAVETGPQIAALLVTPLALLTWPTFEAVVVIAVFQAFAAVLISHLACDQRISFAWDRKVARRLLTYSLPVWLGGVPLIAVYHGDRILVGSMLGMDAIAGYTAAFLVTMAPGLLVARLGPGLLLPMLAEARNHRRVLLARMRAMNIVIGFALVCYLLAFLTAGGPLLAIMFGQAYSDLGVTVALLAVMWALRTLQVVPAMALTAVGETRPVVLTGVLRALGLVPAFFVLSAGWGLVGVALTAVVAESVSYGFIAWCARVAVARTRR